MSAIAGARTASVARSQRRGVASRLIATLILVGAAGPALALPAGATGAPVTSLVSAAGHGAGGPAQSVSIAHASSDGSRIFFMTVEKLVGADTDGLDDVYERSGGQTTLVSAPGAGASGSIQPAFFARASSDGTRVFFETTENLVGGDTDGLTDVYERSGGQTTLVSVPGAGASGPTHGAWGAVASSDGARVFFTTAEKLVGADTDGAFDVYERSGGQTTLVSAPGAGASGSAQDVFFFVAPGDGSRVFFTTVENLVGVDTDGLLDVYERSGGQTTLVSAPGFARNGAFHNAFFAGASSDGTRVFFRTEENLFGGDADGLQDVYERSGSQTTLASASGAGASGTAQDASFAGASSDGTRVFFRSAENLVGGDSDGLQDVYERSGGQTTLASAPGPGASGTGQDAFFAGASSDGSRVFFDTTENLVDGDADGLQDVYERSGGQTTLVSAPGAGASGSAQDVFFARASSDGTRVFFETKENLVGADADGLPDVYERSGGQTTLVSIPGIGPSGTAQDASFVSASSDGTRVVFETTENLVGADTDGLNDIYESRLTNASPALEQIGDRTVGEGELLQLTLSATDSDGDELIYSASNLPPGARFDPASRTFTWTPGSDQAGNYPDVRFQVADGGASDAEDITITVNDLPSGDPDTAPPETTIKSKQRRLTKPQARIRFSSSEPESSFECRLDKRPFKPCASPKKLKRLKDGRHKFFVRAIDAAGNVDSSPAKLRFRVSLPPTPGS